MCILNVFLMANKLSVLGIPALFNASWSQGGRGVVQCKRSNRGLLHTRLAAFVKHGLQNPWAPRLERCR